MKIDTSRYIKNFQGPSDRYYEVMGRFQNILSDKLGVDNTGNNISYNNMDISEDSSLNPAFENSGITKGISSDNSNSFDKLGVVKNREKANYTNVVDIYSKIQNTTVKKALNGKADTSDIRQKSSATVSKLNEKLSGSLLQGQGEHFKRAEDLYGVNAYVLMAIAKLESNWGESQIARDKKNLFGFQAYDSSPYESAKTYNTYAESIYDVAKHLSENYLRPSGKYFNGYSLDGVNVKYCTSPTWASKVKRIVGELTS